MKSVAWAFSVAAMVIAFMYFMNEDTRHSREQDAAMMTVCVNAGGEWVGGWGRPECIRKEAQ